MASVLGLYVNRWQRWVAVGLQGIASEHDTEPSRKRLAYPTNYRPKPARYTGKSTYNAIKKIDRFAVKEKGLKG
jgi:hypothetical protein